MLVFSLNWKQAKINRDAASNCRLINKLLGEAVNV